MSKKNRSNMSRFMRGLVRFVKPQAVTTKVRWIACNYIRNAYTLYCVLKACMCDQVLGKWILPHNTWNYDTSTFCLAVFHIRSLDWWLDSCAA